MFESGSNLIGLHIAKFPPDSIMYEGMELAFNQADQPLYVS